MIAPHIAAWALKRERNKEGPRANAVLEATHIISIERSKRTPAPDPNERVLETKGGAPAPPPQPSPQEQAAARDWEAQQEEKRAQARQDAIDAKAASDKAAALETWKGNRGTAYNTALSSATSRLKSLGIEAGDPYGIYSDVTGRYNAANAGLSDMGDYTTAFAPTVVDEALAGGRTRARNTIRTGFEGALPRYYAEDMFGSTADDAILASILNQQYNDASADLMAARDRGQVSSIAYDRALRDLGTAKAGANTQLQTIGGNILAGLADDINTRRSAALDDIAAWDFGMAPYDVTGETGRIKRRASEKLAGLEGDIRGAVGEREFFDVPGLIGKASARVGNQTTGTTGTTGASALYDTFANEALRKNETTKTNEGTF